jgi:hypothetical protein
MNLQSTNKRQRQKQKQKRQEGKNKCKDKNLDNTSCLIEAPEERFSGFSPTIPSFPATCLAVPQHPKTPF